jgi:hypothetical protein
MRGCAGDQRAAASAVHSSRRSRMDRKLDLYEITSAFSSLAVSELTMSRVLDPFRFVLIAVAGWMNQHQLQIIDYLRDENRVLREQLGGRRVRFNDDQSRRLAAKAKRLGRPDSGGGLTIVTPETLLAWHRRLIANKHDGTAQRGPGSYCYHSAPKHTRDCSCVLALT